MLRSLRSRLVLSNLLLTLLGLLVVAVVFTQLLVSRSTDDRRQARFRQARGLAAEVEREVFAHHGSGSQLQQQLDLASRVLGVRVIVINRSGRITADTARSTRIFANLGKPLDKRAL